MATWYFQHLVYQENGSHVCLWSNGSLKKKERLFYKWVLKRRKNECTAWPQWGKALKWRNRSISVQFWWGWWSTRVAFETVCVGSRTSLWSCLMLLSSTVGFNWEKKTLPNKPTLPIPIYVHVHALHALFWMFSEGFGWLRSWDFWIVRRTLRG